MKKRILTLALALILIFSALAVPAQAVSGKDVHAYLKSIALSGSYDETEQAWYNGFKIGSGGNGDFYFVVGYMEKTKYIHNSIIYFANDSSYLSYEVTWKISSDPSPSYNAYVEIYDKNSSADDTKGVIVLPATYSGEAYSSFKTFSGDSDYKAVMLEILSQFLPGVLEYTRAVINENEYTLRDLGMTGYNKCDWVHAYDKGTVTKEPTCTEEGVLTYTCRVCGETYTLGIEPTGVHTGTMVSWPWSRPARRKASCAIPVPSAEPRPRTSPFPPWATSGTRAR